jgi:tRNA A37 threonylcarbamoyladenosine dehydratase
VGKARYHEAEATDDTEKYTTEKDTEMADQFSRTELLIGKEGVEKLSGSRVAVFGIGGVGGYVVEALVRSGLGSIDLIDNDKVSLTNINRQIIATHKTIGMYKVDAAEERIKEINPEVNIKKYNMFFMPETADKIDFSVYDYVVDAIDTVAGKLEIIERAKKAGVPVISSMGAGNKMHPEMFEVADISKTSVCPLAKVIRQELKKRGIKKVKAVYSKELPIKPAESDEKTEGKRQIPGSNAFVPSAAGLIIAGEVIRDLLVK